MAGVERHNPPISISMLIRNKRGVALLYLIILFTLIGVLVSAGMRQFGSTVNLGKTKDTKAELERDVQMITAWAVKKGRLPITTPTDEYSTDVFSSNPLDAWSRTIYYIYDDNLANISASGYGGLCGRTKTAISVSNGSVDVSNVAFLLLSSSENSSPQNTVAMLTGTTGKLNASQLTSPLPVVSGDITVTTTTDTVKVSGTSDIVRYVTLTELKAQAGCDGSTQGSLKILNNELPNAIASSLSYTAKVYASGGVPPYKWCINGTLPDGIQAKGVGGTEEAIQGCEAYTTSTSGYLSIQLDNIIATAATSQFSFKIKDAQTPSPNYAEKTFSINVSP
jgi:hypothetical protein